MSADLLRQAAALMRSRAEACLANVDEWYEPGEVLGILQRAEPSASVQPYDAEHIASWHPAVALAVADQLEWSAGLIDEAGSGPLAIIAAGLTEKCLAVARAYLGDDCDAAGVDS